MVFIDHMNFEIACSNYYHKSFQSKSPKLDYNKLPVSLVNNIPNARLVRSYVFVPKPDQFLMQDHNLKQYYDWVNGTLRNMRFLDVIDGEYIARPTGNLSDMDINDTTTYYKEEKGTDVNIATYMLSLAFHNAYDSAMLVSGDSDYLPVIEQIKRLGKNIIAVGVKGQNLLKLKKQVDDIIILDEQFFSNCIR